MFNYAYLRLSAWNKMIEAINQKNWEKTRKYRKLCTYIDTRSQR